MLKATLSNIFLSIFSNYFQRVGGAAFYENPWYKAKFVSIE
jgi:hypothetical protein